MYNNPSARLLSARTERRVRRSRLGSRLAATLGLTAALVLAPLAASAHVSVTPDTGTAGGSKVLSFAVGHGCDGSPTTGLRIEMPEGLASVSPILQAGWQVDISRDAEDGLVTAVTYTADEPVPQGLRAVVSMQVRFDSDVAGQSLAFPVEQSCVSGSHRWDDLAEAGEDPHELDAPAPVVQVSEPAEMAAVSASENAEETSALPVGALALGGGGLAAGLAGLVVALVALRRARR